MLTNEQPQLKPAHLEPRNAGPSLQARLAEAAECLATQSVTVPLIGRLQTLRTRLLAGRLQLAVLGQFKRGKSTLLNALLRESVLPTAVVPLTTIPTIIVYGPTRAVQVAFLDGRCEAVPLDRLHEYVTETENPENAKGVAQVEVTHPAEILAQGIVLIDTPGIGSTLTHNTQTTLDFLAEVDAALFLVSVDPPITAVELDFLAQIQARVARIFFLLNKVDYLSAAEQVDTLAFLAKTLQARVPESAVQIFPISARLGLQAAQQQDSEAWETSGMAALERQLLCFFHQQKQATLEEAIAAKARATVQEALALIHMEQRALTMPLAELEHTYELFQKALRTARQQRQQAADLLRGDRRRAVEALNARAASLRQQAEERLESLVLTALQETSDLKTGITEAQTQMAATVDTFFMQQQPVFNQAVEQTITTMLARHAEQANALIAHLREQAADLFTLPLVPLTPQEIPVRLREPYWVRHSNMSEFGFSLFMGLLDTLLPIDYRRRRVVARLQAVAQELAMRNVENLRWGVQQNLEQVFAQFQAHLDAQWAETIGATEQALQRALIQRQQQSNQIEPILERLQNLEAQLQSLFGSEYMVSGVGEDKDQNT